MAASGEQLSRFLQDNILTLACFSDKGFRLVRNSVPVSLFTSKAYRTILASAYDYIDRFGKPPKEHIADELEEYLEGKKGEEGEIVADILAQAKELSETINADYVLSQLSKFVRQQSLKVSIVEAHEKVTQGDLDSAEVILAKAGKQRLEVFNPGTTLEAVAAKMAAGEELRECVNLGIDSLDRLGLGPARKELHLFIGPPKRGKSWWLVHLTKRALIQRWKVVYVTLELAENFVGKRQLMSVFAATSREVDDATVTKLVLDDHGKLEDLKVKKLNRPSLTSPKALKRIRKRLDDLKVNSRLWIKEFPTGSLTVRALDAYLESLEQTQGFSPDLIVLDYADLMQVNTATYRQDLGKLYKDLRGLAVDRNIALATATQSNRPGADAKLIADTHVAEDYSKIHTADCVFTYNQTKLERLRNLARIYVASGRIEADRFAVLISQSYASGQFALESLLMREEYWSFMKDEDDDEDGSEEE